jgi:L-fucose mutarotase
MLKGIPKIIPPELMKILMEMGHGDELLICDGNYPRFGCPEKTVRMDGHGIPEILDAILKFFPLDPYVEHPTTFMAVLPNDPYKPEIWEKYREIGNEYEPDGLREEAIQKAEFYPKGAKCYAAIATSEQALYANVILKKGVVK